VTQIQKPKESGLTLRLVSEMTGFEPAEIALIARTVAVGAPLQELAVFLHSCRVLSLDPLLRQAYWIRRGEPPKGTLQVGIDGFRAIAERSGVYAGAESIEYRGVTEWSYKRQTIMVPELARAVIWKVVAGHKSAFTGEAFWSEFVPTAEKDAFMWASKPRLMLGKCAEAQALRRAFPAQLGSIDYSDQVGADMTNPPVLNIEPEPEPEHEAPRARQHRLAARHAQIFDTNYDDQAVQHEAESAEESSDDN
jgi:phage recombination protein Bet